MMRPLFLLALLALGCAADTVGAPCIPETVPTGGFRASEVYVETASPQCETRVCLVHQLEGDPRPDCTGASCAAEAEVDARVYCTTSCAANEDCPDGFGCGDLGLAGQLCVRSSALSFP